jgi:hypothetical protein
VSSDGAITLYRDPRAIQSKTREGKRCLDGDGKPQAGGADLVQRDAAKRLRQASRASDFTFDPGHAGFIGAHVGTRDVVSQVAHGDGEGADQILFLTRRHPGIGNDHRFSAAMRQACGGVFQRHRPHQTNTFLQSNIRGHADAANRWPARHVVDDDNRFQPDGWCVEVHDSGRPQCIGEAKSVFHCRSSMSGGFRKRGERRDRRARSLNCADGRGSSPGCRCAGSILPGFPRRQGIETAGRYQHRTAMRSVAPLRLACWSHMIRTESPTYPRCQRSPLRPDRSLRCGPYDRCAPRTGTRRQPLDPSNPPQNHTPEVAGS